jgi:hypothetical protein
MGGILTMVEEPFKGLFVNELLNKYINYSHNLWIHSVAT